MWIMRMKLWQRINEIDYDYRLHTQIMIIAKMMYPIDGWNTL